MKIIVQNLAIEYQDSGAGKVLLFLHGWQDDLHTFDYLIPALISKWRVIRLDLPGFGKSEAPKESWNLENYVNFLDEFVKKLDVNVYGLLAHSLGGRIVIKGVSSNHLQAQKLILVASAGIAKNKTFRNMLLKFLSKIGSLLTYIPPLIFFREELRKKMYHYLGSDYLDAGELKKTFLKIIAEDLSACAKKITHPALLIWGEDDTETPLSDGKRFAELIPNSKLAVIKGAGHFVHHEKTQELAKLIEEFL